MKDLRIEYYRWGIRRVLHLGIPERWTELSIPQMEFASQLHLCGVKEEELLDIMCGIKHGMISQLEPIQRYVILQNLEWCHTLDRPVDTFIIHRIPGTRLVSPGRKLRGCSLQQFMTIDTYFQQFTLHPNQERWLNLFVAAIYMRKDEIFYEENGKHPSGKIRAVDVGRNIATIERCSLPIRFAVYINFLLIRVWLSKSYPFLFPPPEDAPTDTHHATKPTDWLAVFDAFIGDDVANMRTYQMMAATDAFRIMNRRIRNAQKR